MRDGEPNSSNHRHDKQMKDNKTTRPRGDTTKIVAEREGFEPSMEFPPYSLSRGAPSATRPSLRVRGGSIALPMRQIKVFASNNSQVKLVTIWQRVKNGVILFEKAMFSLRDGGFSRGELRFIP